MIASPISLPEDLSLKEDPPSFGQKAGPIPEPETFPEQPVIVLPTLSLPREVPLAPVSFRIDKERFA